MSFQYVSKNSRQLGWSSRSRRRSINDRRVGTSSSGLSLDLGFTVTEQLSHHWAESYRKPRLRAGVGRGCRAGRTLRDTSLLEMPSAPCPSRRRASAGRHPAEPAPAAPAGDPPWPAQCRHRPPPLRPAATDGHRQPEANAGRLGDVVPRILGTRCQQTVGRKAQTARGVPRRGCRAGGQLGSRNWSAPAGRPLRRFHVRRLPDEAPT